MRWKEGGVVRCEVGCRAVDAEGIGDVYRGFCKLHFDGIRSGEVLCVNN